MLKRDTLEYENQLKASLEQQKLQEQSRVSRELAERNQAFIQGLFAKAEKEKRETQK